MSASYNGILFALIAGADSTVLCEHSRSKQGTVAINAKKVFNSLPKGKAEKRSYDHEGMSYNILYEANGTLYMAVADAGFNRVQCFNFLTEVKNKFAASNRNPQSFMPELKRQMEFFSDPANDKLARLKENIDVTKGVMIENLDKLIARGEQIDRVVDKTADLDRSAAQFTKNATTLKRSMWKRKMCITIVIILVVLIIIFLIVLFACSKDGVNFKHCESSESSAPSPPSPPSPPAPTTPSP